MAGSRNDTHYSRGYNLLPADTNSIYTLGLIAGGIGMYNVDGDPEGVVSANVGSIAFDRTSGGLYQKVSGTNDTGWVSRVGSTAVSMDNFEVLDHFIGQRQNFWLALSGGGAGFDRNVAVDPAHPGTIQLALGSGAFANIYLGCRYDNNSSGFGSGVVTLQWRVLINTLSSGTNRYNLYIGFSDVDSSEPTTGAYFEYIDTVNSGKFECVTANSSTYTRTDSGVTADTDWHDYKIVANVDNTSVEFYIDDVLVATNTTNLPSSNISPCIYLINNGTASDAASITVDAYLYSARLI
jgi:hypothetical protein